MARTAGVLLLLSSLLLGLIITGTPRLAATQDLSGAGFEFGLFGDLPYTFEDEAKLPNLIADINAANLAFVVHDGDFKLDSRSVAPSRLTPCTDELFYEVRDTFQTFQHPLIYTPGDNEWTDCHYTPGGPAESSEHNPIERLAKLRDIFFQGDQSLGQRTIRLTRQSENPAFTKFPENARWSHGEVMFATLHAVGSNNNLGRTPEHDAEYAERNAANLVWLREAFETARRDNRRGLMIIWQANPFSEFAGPQAPIGPRSDAFSELVETLAEETIAFGKPVVLVHGDTHYFRIDKPLLGPLRRRIENFTRVETFGTPDSHWVHATVDYNDPNLFVFRPRIVEQNLVNQAR